MDKYLHFNVNIDEDKRITRELKHSELSKLPQNELLIRVHFSSLNFKDALSANGHKGVTRNYPHTPGIDAAGIVEKSISPLFNIGDEVIVTSYDLGMNTPGGFSKYISVPANWAVKLPKNLSLQESMVLGTAGFTAALALRKILINTPKLNNVLVTGASGGVGMLALRLLQKLGVKTTALSRKDNLHDYFEELGVDQVVSKFEINSKPLNKPLYSAVIDTVGGSVLSESLKYVENEGSVAVCGMALSPDLISSVYPFILRGVNLVGIDSAETPMPLRNEIWQKLSGEWKALPSVTHFRLIKPESLETYIIEMLNGKHVGRTVIDWR
jgi:putative YhdH/YhfP family quinone oxidoreductase